MGKKYDKPAIIDSKTIGPPGDGCQQGEEAAAPASTSTGGPKAPGKPADRGHLRIVTK